MEYKENYFKRDKRPESTFPGTVDGVANGVFDFCVFCDELLVVTSENINDYQKVALFMMGENLNQDHIDDLDRMSKWFIPMSVLPVYFIVESIKGIDFKKLLTI